MDDQTETHLLSQVREQNAVIISLLEEISHKMQSSKDRFHHVKIEDINMPFGAMVGLMVKITQASIPAALIVAAPWLLVTLDFGGMLAGCVRGLF